ncbi:MAG TPA: hypothetical protein VKA16_03405 [Burkholderiales bacterium]|nr:hypothetical protein [Burkholderiales bacterium]
MSNADVPITSFEFGNGPLRGTHLTLFPRYLLHRGGAYHETIPAHAVAAIRVAFARSERQIGWAVALVVIALVLIGLSAPLAALAGAAADQVAAQVQAGTGGTGQSVAGVVIAAFHFLQTCARLLPVAGAALVLWGAALFALGWLGATTLTLSLGAVERAYSVRGRNLMLYDFAEAVGESVLAAGR